ncbi:hypothetical protein MMC08_002374 [Hypocenomyce scalaris]|nr:hypothetical protein [Hypocenomyce scalaris]
MDYKESYESEVRSQDNPSQPNIWVPEETLPGFRDFMTRFYWVLNKTARVILEGICQSLRLTAAEQEQIFQLHSGHNNQLRLLHYPPTPAEQLEALVLARMPAHTDLSVAVFGPEFKKQKREELAKEQEEFEAARVPDPAEAQILRKAEVEADAGEATERF